jgi:hypothetical protein
MWSCFVASRQILSRLLLSPIPVGDSGIGVTDDRQIPYNGFSFVTFAVPMPSDRELGRAFGR